MLFQLSIPAKKIRRWEPRLFHFGLTYSILILAMTKRKPGTFSATKAVKANARERVGQPKPVRILSTKPRTGRAIKHKPTLEEVIRQAES
jgi:hypothetical protein